MFCRRFSSGTGTVFVTMISRAPQPDSRSIAGPDSRPCVATSVTDAAPALRSVRTASQIVPAVSIMSSTTTQSRPSTSPMMPCAVAWFGRVVSRVLWMNASGRLPSLAAHCSETLMRPASGETIVACSIGTLVRT